MMKKALFFTILVLLAASSFAQDIQNRYLFIEGSASRPDHLDFFNSNFRMEADGAGYVVTGTRSEAVHTFKFNVVSDSYYEPELDMDVEQYVIKISLLQNENGLELISFDFAFADITEMYMFNRTLFLNATAPIPLPLLTDEDSQWQNKWIYFRASFDYPITMYLLQPTGLKGGIGLYNTNPDRVSPIKHEIMAMPGATLGAELQLLNFLSLGLSFQLSFGDTRNNTFVNLGAGVDVKAPIKFKNIILAPYGAFTYNLNASSIFSEFPLFAAGGGIQVCAKGGKRGAFFVDVNYMFSFTDAVMRNPYLDYPTKKEQVYPEPPVIHYKRSQIGIGIGYKIGIIDRKGKTLLIKAKI